MLRKHGLLASDVFLDTSCRASPRLKHAPVGAARANGNVAAGTTARTAPDVGAAFVGLRESAVRVTAAKPDQEERAGRSGGLRGARLLDSGNIHAIAPIHASTIGERPTDR